MRIESLQEGAVLALDQIRANKFRSGLTILGIVVGVAVVMAHERGDPGHPSSIVDEMEAVGPKNFMVARFNMNEVRLGHDGPAVGQQPEDHGGGGAPHRAAAGHAFRPSSAST
jgi:hypothetical protein